MIKWRNDPKLNRYLNEPFVLTEELEKKWYEEVYLKDDTQGFLVIIDKEAGTPIGTLGRANMDHVKRRCTLERLLLGNADVKMYPTFFGSFFIVGDFLYESADVMYAHAAVDNKRALRLYLITGFA